MNIDKKVVAISSYLCESITNSAMEQKFDFCRRAQSWKINFHDRVALLKISNEFIYDNDVVEIVNKFELWCLIEKIMSETRFGILVSDCGISYFAYE